MLFNILCLGYIMPDNAQSITFMLIGMAIGAVIGIIPVWLGNRRGYRGLGAVGWALSTFVGTFGAFFTAIPVVILFTIIIFLMKNKNSNNIA